MSKRNPTSELNHDNWDADEEKEEAGHFKVADQAALKKREIRVAKRRTIGGEDKGTGGLFKGFTGFSGFGSNSSAGAAAMSSFTFGQQPSKEASSESNTNSNNNSSNSNANHLSQLKALNQSVLKWISQHVTESPYCVLTPIFRDYEQHLASIEQKYPYTEEADPAGKEAAATDSASATAASSGSGGSDSSVTFSFSASAKPAAAAAASSSGGPSPPKTNFAGNVSNFKFNAKPAAAEADNAGSAGNAAKESSGSNDDQKTEQSKPAEQKAPLFGFSFSSTSTNGSKAAFSFGSSSNSNNNSNGQPPFSLFSSGQQQQQQQQQEQQQDEEEYEPPNPETREIKEAGAVYTKRCKLFYLSPSDKQWCDKGVGNLHVKPTDNEGKVQLIVRADNTLGSILLNTIISKEMSLTVSKNNLNLACVPNPPLSGKADEEPRIVPFLIRVKTHEDAQQLLAELDKLRAN